MAFATNAKAERAKKPRPNNQCWGGALYVNSVFARASPQRNIALIDSSLLMRRTASATTGAISS